MTAAELRKKSKNELNEELRELRREMFNLRMQKTLQQGTVKFNNFKRVRVDIARIKTILHELSAGAR